MATATLLPVSMLSNGAWTRVGGSSVFDALSDGSDSSYIYNSTAAGPACNMADTPATVNLAGIDTVQVRCRGQGLNSGIGAGLACAPLSGLRGASPEVDILDSDATSPFNRTSSSLLGNTHSGTSSDPAKNDIDGIVLAFAAPVGGTTSSSSIRMIEAVVEVVYDPQPVPVLHPGF